MENIEWGGTKSNFYALLAAIINPKLTSEKALNYFDVQFVKPANVVKVIPSKEELEDLCNVQKLTQSKVAGMYGVSQTTVTKWCRDYGIEVKRHFQSKINEEELIRLRKQGKTQKELAEVFGVTQTTISRFIRRRGLYE